MERIQGLHPQESKRSLTTASILFVRVTYIVCYAKEVLVWNILSLEYYYQ